LGDTETAIGRKWPIDLVVVKSGESPDLGTYGDRVTCATHDGC